MHRETLYIYRTARPETRAYYDCGHYIEGEVEENWIIKWMLWHVFRYRDNRNRGRSNTQNNAREPSRPASRSSNLSEQSTNGTDTPHPSEWYAGVY